MPDAKPWTPGPWTAGAWCGRNVVWAGPIVVVAETEAYYAAADARLIAQSPALYDALEAALPLLPPDSDEARTAREVMARARGEG